MKPIRSRRVLSRRQLSPSLPLLLLGVLALAVPRITAGQSTAPPLDVFQAVSRGDLRRVEELLKQDPSLVNKRAPEDIAFKRWKGFTPLMIAIDQQGLVEMTRLLIAKGADVNATNASGNTGLHLAADLNRFDKAPLLIQAKANVNATNRWGSTPLSTAADRDSRKTAEILIAAGAELDAVTVRGFTALGLAKHRHNKEIESMLLKAGAKNYGKAPD